MARAQEAWSVLKQQFCCKQHSIGCIQTTALPFNCFIGFSALASIYYIYNCINVVSSSLGLLLWGFSGELHLAWSVSKKALAAIFAHFRRRAGAASTSKEVVPPPAWPPRCPTTASRATSSGRPVGRRRRSTGAAIALARPVATRRAEMRRQRSVRIEETTMPFDCNAGWARWERSLGRLRPTGWG